ncbi:MAG: ABC transporter substrate-binding protein [Candidatus Adiutrix sp.]|jgi:iron complex transport system substrate-binding protein|nr:ABC transporter substrate-binding protein [Candidatus Adiutrix sp.]
MTIFKRRYVFTALFCLLLAWAPAALSADREVPDARSVYGPTLPATTALYALDPELIAGWNTPLRPYEKKFIPEKYQKLPVLGGWYGEGFIPDREVLLASGVRKAFFVNNSVHDRQKISQSLKQLGMEIVYAPGGLRQTPDCFRGMGRDLNRPERGEALASYAEKALAAVNEAVGGLPEEKRPGIYFGMQADGLATVCRGSSRAEALEMAGGRNVHECPPGTENSFTHVTFEQLMAYDPEVILIFEPKFFEALAEHRLWSRLSAVKNGRVYLVPRGPFSWLERPATYMRLIGVQWLANILHPDLFPINLPEETRVFMKLFFNVDLDDRQLAELLTS